MLEEKTGLKGLEWIMRLHLLSRKFGIPPAQSGQCVSSTLRSKCYAYASLGQGIDDKVYGLRVIFPCWRSWLCCLGLQRAVAFGVTQRWRQWRNSRWLLSAPLPFCGGVVLCWCVIYVVVVFVSACYVRMLPLLIWCGVAVLLSFIKKESFGISRLKYMFDYKTGHGILKWMLDADMQIELEVGCKNWHFVLKIDYLFTSHTTKIKK